MKIYILAPLHEAGTNWLRERAEVVTYDNPKVKNWHDDADGIIVRGNPVTRDDMERAPRLKVISKHGIGMDVIDLKCARERGIRVTNTPSESVQSVAEQAVGLMLAVSRRICEGNARIHEGRVPHGKIQIHDPFIGCEIFGKTVGLVGFGRIAIATGAILSRGFHAKIKAYAPNVRTCRWAAADYAVEYCEDLKEMVRSCDYVSLHLPLNGQTKGLFSAEVLACCKANAIIVNTGRGGVIDDGALYRALLEKRVQGAASDVFLQEPPDPKDPLFSLPNFIGSPHMGANSIDALIRQSVASCQNVYAALLGQPVESTIL